MPEPDTPGFMEQHHTLLSPRQKDIYLAHGEQLVWAEWEEEHSLYNRATGETHILSALPVEILKSLSKQPAGVSELAQRLALLSGIECSPGWVETTADSLRILQGLELVEQLQASSPRST